MSGTTVKKYVAVGLDQDVYHDLAKYLFVSTRETPEDFLNRCVLEFLTSSAVDDPEVAERARTWFGRPRGRPPRTVT